MLLRGRKQRVPEFVGMFVYLLACKYAVYGGDAHTCVCILIHDFRVCYYNFIRLFIHFNFCLWILSSEFH